MQHRLTPNSAFVESLSEKRGPRKRRRMIPMSCSFSDRAMTARLSYCLYLVHYPLLPLAVALSPDGAFPVVGFWITYLAVSFAVAGLLHFSVEKPFLVLKDKLARGRVARATA